MLASTCVVSAPIIAAARERAEVLAKQAADKAAAERKHAAAAAAPPSNSGSSAADASKSGAGGKKAAASKVCIAGEPSQVFAEMQPAGMFPPAAAHNCVLCLFNGPDCSVLLSPPSFAGASLQFFLVIGWRIFTCFAFGSLFRLDVTGYAVLCACWFHLNTVAG